MKEAIVEGRFVWADGTPVEGTVKFVPSKIWLDDDDGLSYPCYAPEAHLLNGEFQVTLTRTDTYLYPWHYTAETPIGAWTIEINHEGPLSLKDLLRHLT